MILIFYIFAAMFWGLVYVSAFILAAVYWMLLIVVAVLMVLVDDIRSRKARRQKVIAQARYSDRR